jgi:hypothetical protein
VNLPAWCYEVPWLSVKQPWADLLLAGVKDVENRSWPPPSTLPQWGRCSGCGSRVWPSRWVERGVDPARFPFMWAGVECQDCGSMFAADGPFPFRLGIHTAAKPDTSDEAQAAWFSVYPDYPEATKALDLGALLGSVEVTGCHHADECQHAPDTWGVQPEHCSRWAQPDVYHWEVRDPQLLDPQLQDLPVPWKGRQGLWGITAEVTS